MRWAVLLLGLSACDGQAVVEGAPGPVGPPGQRGPAGSSWAPSIVRETALDGVLYPQERIVAVCPEGYLASGGGCRWGKSPGDMMGTRSAPAEDLSGWECSGLAMQPGEVQLIEAFVVCVEEP